MSDRVWNSVHDSRETFLSCIRALSDPGKVISELPLPHDSGFGIGILHSLLDPGVPCYSDTVATDWLFEEIGAPEVAIQDASFIYCTDDLFQALAQARKGGATNPQDGATVVYAPDSGTAEHQFRLSGPGLESPVVRPLPLSPDFAGHWKAANSGFPQGVDLFIACGAGIIGLPRTTTVESEA